MEERLYSKNISLDKFKEEVWDLVSEKVVSDKVWDNNPNLIHHLTVAMYNMYITTIKKSATNGDYVAFLGKESVARAIEYIFTYAFPFRRARATK